MYSYISGRLIEIQEGSVVVENGGMGYELVVSNTTLGSLPQVGQDCKLFCHLTFNTTDNELTMYGFLTKQEKNMFLLLTEISGVGPKTALTILSGVKVENLVNAILTGDTHTIASAKGVGKKTAERIVLELKEKVGNLSNSGIAVQNTTDSVVTAVLDTLESMGLPRQVAYDSVIKARQQSSDFAEIIRIVLRGIAK